MAGQIGAGGLGLGHLLASGDHGDADGLAGGRNSLGGVRAGIPWRELGRSRARLRKGQEDAPIAGITIQFPEARLENSVYCRVNSVAIRLHQCTKARIIKKLIVLRFKLLPKLADFVALARRCPTLPKNLSRKLNRVKC